MTWDCSVSILMPLQVQTMIKEAVYIQILDKISVQIEGATTRMCFDFISS